MNNNSLDQLRAKRKLWIECMSGKDRNSILNQINNLVWNAAVFKVINESRKYLPIAVNGERQANEMLHSFINRCFFDSQFSTIRRLTDGSYKLDDSKRGVTSLVALLKDMESCMSLMTRENMFMVDGLEYDYEVMKRREEAYHQRKKAQRISTYPVPEELNSQNVKDRHEELDILCGVEAVKRHPDDSIRQKVFETLIKKITEATKNVKLQVDKYIAHAATPGSREYDNAENVTITFEQLWNAHKVICQVTNFVDSYMLSRTNHAGILPVPIYNHFEFIDNPLVTKENINKLRETWNGFQKEADSWSTWSLDDFKVETTQNDGGIHDE